MTASPSAAPMTWHLHFRDGATMRAVVPFTARQFARAIVMPNLAPPVTTAAMARGLSRPDHGRRCQKACGLRR